MKDCGCRDTSMPTALRWRADACPQRGHLPLLRQRRPGLGGGRCPITAAAEGCDLDPPAARGLRHRTRRPTRHFRCILVAHSMGGLVCRCFLQNDISAPDDRALVSKVFTRPPHNGIEKDGRGLNVPALLGLWDMNNFNRKVMAGYLGLPEGSGRVDSLAGKFDPQRFFCLVGTNHRDYPAALGLSRALAGEMSSDGLVQIANATVQGAPRAPTTQPQPGLWRESQFGRGLHQNHRYAFCLATCAWTGCSGIDALPTALGATRRRTGTAGARLVLFQGHGRQRHRHYTLTERRCIPAALFCAALMNYLRLDQGRARRTAFAGAVSVFSTPQDHGEPKTVVFSVQAGRLHHQLQHRPGNSGSDQHVGADTCSANASLRATTDGGRLERALPAYR